MAYLHIDLAITIESALHIGGSGSLGSLADKTLLRDGWDRLLLPGSQLKGRLRHACEALARTLYPAEPVCRGPRPDMLCPHEPSAQGDEREPALQRCLICTIFGSTYWPSPLRFNNLIHDPDYDDPTVRATPFTLPAALRPGVGLERRRRTAQHQVLFLTETSQPGTRPRFRAEGAIEGVLPTKREAALLLAGFALCQRWGGGKSRGLGWSHVAVRAHFDDELLVDTITPDGQPMDWEVLRG